MTKEIQAAQRGPFSRSLLVAFGVSLVVLFLFIWLLSAGGLPVIPAVESFASVRWWTVAAYTAVWSLVLFLRSARWVFLLRPLGEVPMARILRVSFIGMAALVVLPLRMGEVVRPALISRDGRISGWAAAGTVGAERVVDGLALSLVLLIGLEVSVAADLRLPDAGGLSQPVGLVRAAARTAAAGFACAFAMMSMFYWRRAWARRTTERLVGVVSSRAATWIADRLERVATGLRFLPQRAYLTRFLALTVAYWLLNVAGLWLLTWGCGFDQARFAQSCVLMGILALAILVPNAPGYFGSFQLSVYAGLALFFSAAEVRGPGAALVFLLYAVQITVTLVCGAISLALEHVSPREALEAKIN